MGTTHPNGIWEPDAGAPIDWHVTPSIFGAAADMAIAGRTDGATGPLLLHAANLTEANAVKESPRRVGDQIYRGDIGTFEEYGVDGWKLVKTLRGIRYTPNWQSEHRFVAGPGSSQFFHYWVDGSEVTVMGEFSFGFDDASGPLNGTFAARVPVPDDLPMKLDPSNLGAIGLSYTLLGGSRYMGTIVGMYANEDLPPASNAKIYPTITFHGGTSSNNGNQGMRTGFPASWEGTSNIPLAVSFTYQT